ncbi:hypothetical protein EZ313_18180 [Ramlibacter henchirensis]|uniref:Uncharacterized protein n=1 Tax=Ramlibacter henchirensis TaxID=204072 RepID=A0A4Z0BPN2_9BURK|nr:AMP-binding protein [Ramlibacter henchirensis]TFZ00394.1 hypothetical protein EZ313_18180 [Ramlibacter henchirensis]
MADWIPLARVALPGASNRPVALRGGVVLDHGRFAADVARWREAFSRVGGEKVALHFADSYDFGCALFGAWHAGKVPVLPGDAQPDTLERLLPQVAACAGELPGAIVPPATGRPGDLQELDPHAARLLIYTSGSSGKPLAIPKRLAQLDAEVRHQEAVFGARLDAEGPVVIHATVSHQHIYGLLFLTIWPLAAGRCVSAEKLEYPEQLAARLAQGSCVLVSSPAHLRRIPESLDWSGARSHLRAVFSSGGPLPPESSQGAHELWGQSPIEVYGSSETGGVAWRQRAYDGDAWTPLPGVHWRLEEGTLHVRSAHLENDDWWETSDVAKALPDGRFVLKGRVDRIVKVEEKRVSLPAMEKALQAGGLIAEAKVLPLEDRGATRLAVVAVPTSAGWDALRTQGKREFNEQLRSDLLRGFERVVLPRRFRFVRELPVNTQGKSTEALLSALFQPDLPSVQWRVQGPQAAVATLDIVPQLRVLDGHFPGAPVLPGVAQLHWAAVLGRQSFPLPGRFVRAEQLKFQMPIVPPLQLDLSLEWDAQRQCMNFSYTSALGTHSCGRLVFRPDDV